MPLKLEYYTFFRGNFEGTSRTPRRNATTHDQTGQVATDLKGLENGQQLQKAPTELENEKQNASLRMAQQFQSARERWTMFNDNYESSKEQQLAETVSAPHFGPSVPTRITRSKLGSLITAGPMNTDVGTRRHELQGRDRSHQRAQEGRSEEMDRQQPSGQQKPVL
ncbi:hypothetical protein CDL15_Pgr017278 [Punica granatum]|uniref:Uncharacterized protein n=1 Tax=Punica granatum TaxID=22663 RepID=A0A218WI91_PUNGR|nr:hypothetical protein CDL15_Pgr017278 [Punica granatum]PKI63137.1 hypothetical protein CRG98_016469 [Punica granatum]